MDEHQHSEAAQYRRRGSALWRFGGSLGPRGRAWRRRYASVRAIVAVIVLASLVVPGIAAVIAAAVSAW
jgi:hypothetical protein